MNKIYYKGYLCKINPGTTIKSEEISEYLDKCCTYEDDKHIGKILHDYWLHTKNMDNVLNDNIFIDKLNSICKNTIDYKNSKLNLMIKKYNVYNDYFIFEIIEDQNNNKFAKEIFTNKIFPLIKKEDINVKYIINDIHTKMYSYSFKDNERQKYIYELNVSYSYDKDDVLKLNNFFYLPFCDVATPYQVSDYLNNTCKFKPIFGKEKDNKKLKDLITNLSNNNTFKEEIIEKKEEIIEREKQDEITTYMEKIEFLLLKLDKVNHKIKEEKQQKYNNLLNSYNKDLTTSPLNKETLKMLEAEIEFAIKYNQKCEDDILNTLDNIINEYNTNNTTDRTISDIDELVKLFLQMKSNYSPIIQRNSIEKFALIYIYEIYENRNTITIEDLSDSYINDILTSVLICLNNMINNNEIENNIIIKLEGDITLSYIINCIKEIKFIKNKELIKE